MVSAFISSPAPAVSCARRLMRRRELLPLEDHAVWEIESGFLRSVVWDEEGNITTLGIWGPGEQVSGAFSRIQPLQIECIVPVRLRYVASQTADVRMLILNRAQRAEELLLLLQIRCTEARLRGILLWLAQRFGHRAANGMLLPLRLTHQELADLIGSTRVTVTRLLSQLQAKGELQILSRQFLLREELIQTQPWCLGSDSSVETATLRPDAASASTTTSARSSIV